MQIATFSSDLSDSQWALLEPLLPPAALRGRPRTPLRLIMNALFYMAKTGCQWRMLPQNFPPWKTVYHHFSSLGDKGLWREINGILRGEIRKDDGRHPQPTAAILDSQSIKSAAHGGTVGYDAGKKIKGRKRFIVVDVMGMVLDAMVCPASETERDGGQQVLVEPLKDCWRLRKIWVDSGYSGAHFSNWVQDRRGDVDVEVVTRIEGTKGFEVQPWRWVVERTFGWLMHNRRLARDYERTGASALSWIFVSMIGLMTRRTE